MTSDVRQAIEGLLSPVASVPHVALPPVWYIPYARNSLFTGRDDVLAHLEAQLQLELPGSLAISGLGGIGKTQVAIEYAYKHRQHYQTVLWATASSKEDLFSSYVTIAELLSLPEKDDKNHSITVQAVKMWLQSHRQWLLILDNVDEMALVSEFLPMHIGGHLLLTTRAQAMGGLVERIAIETFSPEQGMLFLLRRAALLTPDILLEQVSIENRRLAMQVVQELGGLPLALDQAGAYLEETGCRLLDYLHIYQQHRMKLLAQRGGLAGHHPEPVASTWSLSFDKVEQENPAAADLLRLCAFLDPNAIPREILTQGVAELGPLLEPLAEDEGLFYQALRALRAYSLVNANSVDGTLSLHRLVQAVIREALPAEKRKLWMQRAVSAVDCAFPFVEFAQWAACERCLPHALACALWIEQEHMTFPGVTHLLNQTAFYLYTRGLYAEAEPLYLRALTIDEQRGTDDPEIATGLNNLALLYKTQGRYAEAEPLYWRALTIDEQRGTDDPEIAITLNNLAALCFKQGKYAEAEPLYLRALAIDEQGTDHSGTATTLNNLAELYRAVERYTEAESLCQRALTICERHLGTDCPGTAITLNNLAELYRVQGRYAEAEPLCQRALTICEQQLGASHPDTAKILNTLAECHRVQGRYTKAESLYQRTLTIREQRLGVDHPDTAMTLNNLAELYRAQGRYAEAKPLYWRALVICEQRLDPKHPMTCVIRDNYQDLLSILGNDQDLTSDVVSKQTPSWQEKHINLTEQLTKCQPDRQDWREYEDICVGGVLNEAFVPPLRPIESQARTESGLERRDARAIVSKGMMEKTITIFISYAHEDEDLRKALEKHLSLLKRQGLVDVWHDRDVSAGTDWEQAVSIHLSTAQIILLLISPDFMASEYCYSVEMIRAVERHQAEEARVIPIILRPVDWEEAPFGQFQALPTDAAPIVSCQWQYQDEAFVNVVKGLRRAIKEFVSRQL